MSLSFVFICENYRGFNRCFEDWKLMKDSESEGKVLLLDCTPEVDRAEVEQLFKALAETVTPGSDEDEEEEKAPGAYSPMELTEMELYFRNLDLLKAGECDSYDYHRLSDISTVKERYEFALEHIDTDYVCLSTDACYYGTDIISKFNSAIAEYPEEIIFTFNHRSKKKSDIPEEERITKVEPVDLRESFSRVDLFLPACILKADTAKTIPVPDVCEEEIPLAFLFEVLKKTERYVAISGLCCRYDTKMISHDPKSYYGCKSKEYYIDSLEKIYLPLQAYFLEKESAVPKWVQMLSYYGLYFKYYSNANVRNKFLLDDKETDMFFALSKAVLVNVDDAIIMDDSEKARFKPPLYLRNLFLFLKYGNEEALNRSFRIEDGELCFYQCGCRYSLANNQQLTVKAMTIHGDRFVLDLQFVTHLLYQYNPDAVSCYINNLQVPVRNEEIYTLNKVFGVTVDKKFSFQVDVPLISVKKENTSILFKMKIGEEEIELPLTFHRAASKLLNVSENSYWPMGDDLYMQYKANALVVKKMNGIERAALEMKYMRDVHNWLKEKNYSKEKMKQYYGKCKKLRSAYFTNKMLKPKRRIWLYFDKLYKAGDNGEYQFAYSMENLHDGVERYYIINEDSFEYPRLKAKYGDNILTYGSKKCMLYALLAEVIIATHPDIIEFFGYNKISGEICKSLFNARLVCIAHGVTIQKNADYQNRLFDNTMFYTTSSKYEVNHILHPIYGYKESEVALTGMARFDGLKNNDQRQILITPTWRRDIIGSAKRNSTRTYASMFKESNYFKIYNRLVNDEQLIKVAKETGYRIIFLAHPAMSSQIDDYDRNDYVEFLAASGDMNYEKILTESSLMVTDYSGVHYDFGYMRKPVVYYQPKEVPMRFEEGGMKFATMGFGPVIKEYDDVIECLCRYMENDCQLEPEYKAHADDFFAFDDYNNCERIHNAVVEWLKTEQA